jgi:hypothetical protein
MNEVIKTPGKHIAYETTAKSIIFGDDDLSINLKNREADEVVTIDVCKDRNGNLTMGTAAGLTYVAQVEIPARQYTEEEQENPAYDAEAEEGTEAARETIVVRTPVGFNIDNCTIYLWGMED